MNKNPTEPQAPARTRRVVHIMSELRPGGAELRTLELLRHLREKNVKHDIVTLTGRDGELASAYRSLGISVTPLRLRHLSFFRHFMAYLRKMKPDVVHSHINHSNGLILTVARAARVPVRISHYRSDTPNVRSLQKRTKRGIMKLLTCWNATVIAGVSPTVLTHAWSTNWQNDSRCCVLLNGFNTDTYRNVKTANLRSEFGINEDDYIILHVGRGVPSKNRERAISILAALKNEQGPRYHLVFVGRDGGDVLEAEANQESLRSLAAKHGVDRFVVFAGERADIAEVLHSGDVLLVTSTLEGLPGVVLEAAACELPIVASALPGVRFIAENGVKLSLVSLEQEDSTWANEIVSRLQGSRANIARGNPAGLQGSIFDMKRVSESYLRVWYGAAPGRGEGSTAE